MDSRDNENRGGGGIGFCGLLTIAFIVLKLCGVINWPWLWVLAPAWIPAAIAAVIFTIATVIVVCREINHRDKRGRT